MKALADLIVRVLDLLPHKVIVNCERDPYLRRWYLLRTKAVGVFIHQFIRSDEDRALHDHPWAFIVIPIWRGYVEHHVCRECDEHGRYWMIGIVRCPFCHGSKVSRHRVYPLLGARVRPATYQHRVELIDGKPSWSIFIRFRECRVWGFHLPSGFMAWNRWWQEKCE